MREKHFKVCKTNIMSNKNPKKKVFSHISFLDVCVLYINILSNSITQNCIKYYFLKNAFSIKCTML